jgi:HPt (histidine-containing phosphotransfer) domain-containing protein
MSPYPQWIDWMPSPPLAPDSGPIDLDHLERATFGDIRLEREVLSMFLAQAARLLAAILAAPGEAGALAHTLKGSARAIGAFGVADHALALENDIRERRNPLRAAAELQEAVAEARAAIESILG